MALAAALAAGPSSAAPPPNDAFANGLPLSPGGLVTGTLDEATPDLERPDLSAGLRPSVWYRWTPVADGQLNLRLRGVEPDAQIDGLAGATLSTLSRIPVPGTTVLAIDVKAGRSYAIAITANRGTFELESRFDPGAAADSFADRTVIAGEHFEIVAGRRYPTQEDSEGLSPNLGSLWWSWTAPASGMLVVRATDIPTVGNLSDHTVLAFSGDQLDRLALAPIEPYFGQRLEAGRTYALRLLMDNMRFPTAGTDFRASFDLWPIEPNEDFADRIVLSGDSAQLTGDDHASWLENGEPNHGLATSLWWEWTAPFDGTVEFRVENDGPGGALRIFDQHPFDRLGVVPLPLPTTVVRGGKKYYLCAGSPLVGGGQALAERGRRTWSLRLSPEIAPVQLTTGYFSFSTGLLMAITGPLGARVQVASSTNLTTWSSLTTVVLEAPSTSLWDEAATQEPQLFYRATLLW